MYVCIGIRPPGTTVPSGLTMSQLHITDSHEFQRYVILITTASFVK